MMLSTQVAARTDPPRCAQALRRILRRDRHGPGPAPDHGSQYTSDAFQKEIAFLGIESSPSFVRCPEGNGCIERFSRTPKEQLLWVRISRNAEEVRLALMAWVVLYNERWLIERLGHRPPAVARRQLLALRASA